MTQFIYGLNVNKSFSDIPDPEESLVNLGLDIRDLEVIRGVADAGVTQNDLVRLSGLDLDARKELSTIYGDLSRSTRIIEFAPDIRFTIKSDHIVDNKLKSKSFKYNYIAYDQGNAILGADISTSRVSSWSSFDSPTTSSSPIFYGGDVEVIPTPATSRSQIRNTELSFDTAPAQRRFAAEVPTHLVKAKVAGVDKQFYAMKGIPVTFNGYFRSVSLKSIVTAYSNIFPTWVITNLDNGIEYAPYEDVALNYDLKFVDSRARPRKVEFYYPPDNIRELKLDRMNISQWTNVILGGLNNANLAINDLREMPDFSTLTPNLSILNLKGNDMSRAVDVNDVQIVANTQLSILPTSLTNLTIDGCFSDSTDIDISYITSLQTFNFDSSYDIVTRSPRRRYMSSIGPTPKVNSNSIVNYNVTYHRYRSLDTSVTSSTTIRSVGIRGNNIVSDSANNDIAFNNNANNMVSFSSYSNSHNVVDFSGHDKLTRHYHTYSRNLRGSTTIEGKLNGCDSLTRVIFYATDVTGNFDGSIANLGSLTYCDLRYTRIHGAVKSSSFINTASLTNLYFAGSYLGLDSSTPSTATQYDNTFDYDSLNALPDLKYIYCYNARYVTGNLPDFSLNANLYYIYFHSTKFTGGLTSFSTNKNLQWLFVRYSLLNQTAPTFTSASLRGIYLNNNLLYGTLAPFVCQNLYYLYMNNNNLGKDQSGNIDATLGRIPSMASSPRLRVITLHNNFFTSYTEGALKNITNLRYANLSNNQLSLQDAFAILSDMDANWNLNNRSGVRVDLRGNPGITEDAILNDSIAGNSLLFLRSRGWSIYI